MSVSLENELLEHLRIKDSVEYLRQNNFDTHLIYDLDIRSVANWTLEYLEKYGETPTDEVMSREWAGLELQDSPETTLNIAYLTDKLKNRFVLNKQRSVIEKLADITEPDEFVKALNGEAFDLWRKTANQSYIYAGADHENLIEKYKEEAKNPKRGLSFGFKPLDDITGGAKGGHLTFLAARPKRYKTWIALQAFVEQRKQGIIPVFFTLELSLDEIYQRLMCLVSGFSYTKMTLSPERISVAEWNHINKKMKAFDALGPSYILAPPFEERTVDNMVMEVKRLGGESVIIDQLNYIQPKGKYYNRDEGPREVVHAMKNSANNMDIPWYCLCQLSRDAANIEDMATADMTGLTRAIEETCDLLLGLHRTKEMASRNIVQMGIIEARHCPSEISYDIAVELGNKSNFHMYED